MNIFKFILREIKQNILSFVLLAVVTLLGVGFLAGIFSCVPNMQSNAIDYYNDTNFHDIKIIARLGFSERDITELEELDYISKISASHSFESTANINGAGNFGTYVKSVNIDTLQANPAAIADTPVLISGSYPATDNSCLVVRSAAMEGNIKIGDRIALISNTDACTQTVFTVTGFVNNPEYASDIKESMGDGGKTELVIFVSENVFRPQEKYNELSIKITDADKLSPFSDEYFELVNSVKLKLDERAATHEQNFGAEMSEQDKNNIDKAQKHYEYIKGETERQLKEVENNIKNLEKKIEEQKLSLDAAKTELDALKAEVDKLAAGSPPAEEPKPEEPAVAAEQPNAYAAALAKYENAKKAYDLSLDELTTNELTCNQLKSEYEKLKVVAQNKVDDAASKLNSAGNITGDYNQIWNIYSRSDNESFNSFLTNVQRLIAVTGFFPSVFFGVSMVLVISIISYIISRRRTQMGIMRSLGFNDRSVAYRHIGFALLSSGIGAVLGAVLGTLLIPQIMFGVYKDLYVFPNTVLKLSPTSVILPLLIAVAVAAVTAIYVCISNLRGTPALLLENKGEEIPKAAFIEKIKYFNLLPELLKNAIRNAAFYKKKLITSAVAYIGCAAIILSGLGLKGTVGNIAEKQYALQPFDITATVSGDYTAKEELTNYLKNTELVAGYTEVNSAQVSGMFGEKPFSATVVSKKAETEFDSYFKLETVALGKKIELQADSVVVGESFARQNGIKKGSVLNIGGAEFTVTDICRNYIGNYIFLGDVKASTLPADTLNSSLIIKNGNAPLDNSDSAALLSSANGISALSFTADTLAAHSKSGDKIESIINAFILFSLALLFVAILVFTGTDAANRKIELSGTQKYFKSNLSAYLEILCENAVVALPAIIIGIAAGYALHAFTAASASAGAVYFPRFAGFIPALYAFGATVLVFVIVNLLIFAWLCLKKLSKLNKLKKEIIITFSGEEEETVNE